MVQVWWTSTNHIESWIASKKDHAVNLVELERCCVFWATSKEPDNQFRCLLSTTNETGSCNQRKTAELANRKGIVIHHDNTRSHTSLVTLVRNYWSLVGKWCRISHIALTWHHLIIIYFEVWHNSLNGKNFTNDDDLKSTLVQFFSDKDQKFYERNHEAARKMEKGPWTKWKIYNWLKFILCKKWVFVISVHQLKELATLK